MELVLFDVGGTLYDDDCFAQALHRAVRELAEESTPGAGGPDWDDAEFWAVYDAQRERGTGSLRTAMAKRYAPGRDEELARRARKHWQYPADALYQDVKPVLTALSGRYRLGIVANSPTTVLDALRRDGLLDLFDVTVLAEQIGVRKPDVTAFQYALREAGVSADRVLYVGNRLDTDIRPAHRVGMRAVWMLRGEAAPAPTQAQLAEPDAVLTTLTGLPVVLARMARSASA
ncbi:HAD family hydrolase [Streptomyces sp. B-S-A12]|uniref:HAD family hydrolase n=1 Tax=Streptomyces luteolus TaxID=3043615 RepID=A0ABT6SPS8_9ACTN|nr:HAD family hydrolase [Streptomyces sp. B-S-A12]MDI3417596.1 HAD family hydrolase [Streptomyces sp. B-S-A12]